MIRKTIAIIAMSLALIAALGMAGCAASKSVAAKDGAAKDGAAKDQAAKEETHRPDGNAATDGNVITPSEIVAVNVGQHPAGSPNAFIPKAVVYRTNGDYSAYVPVALSADRRQIVSYPAPTDLTAGSTPLDLGDGWLLDRRGGIGPDTAFLSYTYDEYRSLKSAPTAAELMQKIIPGAHVTRVVRLPITINQANADPQAIMKYLPE